MMISVITISFKDEVGLRATVRSVAEQTHPEIEHIVIDGGSGADVAEYLEGEEQLSFWSSEPDLGRYDAMNKGLARATGDYVWFLHSGDVFAGPTTLEDVVSKLDGHPTWGFGQARIVSRKRDLDRPLFGRLDFSLHRFALGGRPVPHQAAFFRTSEAREVGPYSLGHGMAADQLWILRFAQRANPLLIEDVVCLFDADGAGSVRPLSAHYSDMRAASKTAGIAVGGSRLVHWMLSRGIQLRATLAMRFRNSVLKRRP